MTAKTHVRTAGDSNGDTIPSVNSTSSATSRDKTIRSAPCPIINLTNESNSLLKSKLAYAKRASGLPHSFFSTWIYQPKGNTTSKAGTCEETPTQLITDKLPNETLTLADLEEILRANRYVRELDLPRASAILPEELSSDSQRDQTYAKSGVAFPQASLVTYRDLTIGSTIAAGFLGAFLGSTIFPSLWLLGCLIAGTWGYGVAKNYKERPTTNILGETIISLGRRLAKFYLFVYDAIQTYYFLYKTGQLSYAYYKRYAKLDERFAITDKVDAWNAWFQEGKRSFDKWERENEVGRKVLASLRTIWLVEEQSLMKQNKRKYRIVQIYDSLVRWGKKFLGATWRATTGGGSSELRDVLQGIRISISESRLEEIVPRIAAAFGAFIVLNMVGALFAIAPNILGLVAITTGLVWPSWVGELRQRITQLLSDLRAQGQGRTNIRAQGDMLEFGKQRFYDKSRYNFFVRSDGTRRWYRTGHSVGPKTPFVASGSSSIKKNAKKASLAEKSWWSLKQDKKPQRRPPSSGERWTFFG
jgi:hypothetical protein